jgi:hypothetical protein
MSSVRERFSPKPMAANATLAVPGSEIGGFLAKTAGTISVTVKDAQGTDLLVVDAVPLTAGIFTPIPIIVPAAPGLVVVLAGGASGTLMV